MFTHCSINDNIQLAIHFPTNVKKQCMKSICSSTKNNIIETLIYFLILFFYKEKRPVVTPRKISMIDKNIIISVK